MLRCDLVVYYDVLLCMAIKEVRKESFTYIFMR